MAAMRKGSTIIITPKGPRVEALLRDDFDRPALLAKLFALPLPPAPWARQYPIHTPLGRIMRLRGLKVRDVDGMEGCPNYRLLSDYLAGRKPVRGDHRVALARALDVDPRIF